MGFSLNDHTGTTPSYTHVKKVAIIGAGVGGLQLAERLGKVDGMQVKIFEKTGKVGGVWSANYADFGLQVPKELYEFPSFPYPANKEWDRFPKGPAVQEYIEAFTEHFELHKVIQFNTTVLEVEPSEGGWMVAYAPTGSAITTREPFDFVVVATGMYGGASPHIPAHPGKETFKGEVLHSFHFADREQARGKRVVVVGGGKSSVDCAVAAVKGGATEVTLLFRSAHWPVPRLILDLIPFKFATYSRFGHSLLPTHHDVSSLAWWVHSLLTPLKWLVWRLVEIIFAFQFEIPTEMRPTSRIEIDVFTGGQILTYEARDMIKAGSLQICRDSIATYTASGVDLQRGGASIECDMVVYGTGFTKSYDYFPPNVQAKLNVQKDGLYLYRSLLPIGVPGLAFLGSEVSTFNNILTHGLQAAWLMQVLSGGITLPPTGQMQLTVEKEMNWKRTWMPATSARAAIQQLHMPKYHDALVADMGLPVCRKSNPLFELLVPYNARDYRAIFGLPDRTAWMRLKSSVVLFALLPLILGSTYMCTRLFVAATTCAAIYALPEEPPSLLLSKGHLNPERSPTSSGVNSIQADVHQAQHAEEWRGLRQRKVHSPGSPRSPRSPLASKNASFQ